MGTQVLYMGQRGNKGVGRVTGIDGVVRVVRFEGWTMGARYFVWDLTDVEGTPPEGRRGF